MGLTNLALDHESPASVAGGITALVADIHARRPRAKVVVLDIFPASGNYAEAVRETNDLLAQRITLRNTGFYRVGHSIPPPDFPDGLHLSSDGYIKLAKELTTIITTMYYSGSGWPPHPWSKAGLSSSRPTTGNCHSWRHGNVFCRSGW